MSSVHASDFRLRVASQPFAHAALASISLGAPGSSAKTRKETHTGFEFPTEVCHKTKPCPSLAGLGWVEGARDRVGAGHQRVSQIYGILQNLQERVI